jgi:hypothetical protein
MLEKLSDEALGELGLVLSNERAFRVNAASPEAFSPSLHSWLLDATAREQGLRRGETHDALLIPALAGEELVRARMYAAALAMTFANLREFIPADASATRRERLERLAHEIEPAMLTLAEALDALHELSQWTVH